MLAEGRMLLRDIIDLETTYGGGPGSADAGVVKTDGTEAETEDGTKGANEEETKDAKETRADADGGNGADPGEAKDNTAAPGDGSADGDGEAEEINLTLAVMEDKLKPEVIETFEKIASTHTKLHRLQMLRLDAMQKGENLSTSQERRLHQAASRDGRIDGGRPPQQRTHRAVGGTALRPQPGADRL